MGDELPNPGGLTLQISAPAPCSLRLLCHGREMGRWENQSNASYLVPAGDSGVYRAEAHLPFKGKLRGWIYSNPIYVRPGRH
jgi:hypothetical protein